MHRQRMLTTLVRCVRPAHVHPRRSQRVDPGGSLPLPALAYIAVPLGWRARQCIQPALRFKGPIVRSNRPTTGHVWIDRRNCRAPYRCDVAGEDRAGVVMQSPTAMTVLQTHPCGPPFVPCPVHSNVVTPRNELDVGEQLLYTSRSHTAMCPQRDEWLRHACGCARCRQP